MNYSLTQWDHDNVLTCPYLFNFILLLIIIFCIEQLHTILGCCLFSVGVVIKDCKLNACLHSFVAEIMPFMAIF